MRSGLRKSDVEAVDRVVDRFSGMEKRKRK